MSTQNPDQDLTRFRQLFLEEAQELLETLESGLLELDKGNQDPALLHSIFRAAHSIKGNAGMTGYDAVTAHTHVLEGVLDDLRNNVRQPDPELTSNLLQGVDALRDLLTQPPEAPAPPSAIAIQELLAPKHAEDEAEEAAAAAKAKSKATKRKGEVRYRIRWTPPEDCMNRGAEPLRILWALTQLGKIESVCCDTSNLPALEDIDTEKSYLGWAFEYVSKAPRAQIDDVFTFQSLDAQLTIEEVDEPAPAAAAPPAPAAVAPNASSNRESSPEPAKSAAPTPAGPAPAAAQTATAAAAPAANETIRVAASKLDSIFDLVGEMVIAQSMAMQVLRTMPEVQASASQALSPILEDLERQTRDLQEQIMSLRLVPVDQVFRRLPRLVHDLSSQLGKKIQLEIEGADTEIDRALVEKLADPLVHLMRNCADHGIESPDVRVENGKPEHGTIRLSARCQGGSTIVEIEDDGRGLDTTKIREKAIRQGLIKASAELNEKALHSLIFHPGFSTAEQVTNISGRGVGMDAVRSSLQSVSGSISVTSTKGKGAKFVVHLPMTMAILDGLLIRAGSSILVAPMAAVIECIRPLANQIRQIPTKNGAFQEVLLSRERVIPVLRLRHLLHLEPSTEQGPKDSMAILIDYNNQQSALLADEIIGQQQVVIKNLDTNYRRVEGFQGATILGNGCVALVLDFGGLLRIHESYLEGQTAMGFDHPTYAFAQQQNPEVRRTA